MIVIVVGYIVCVDFQNVDFGFIKKKSGDFWREAHSIHPLITTTTLPPPLFIISSAPEVANEFSLYLDSTIFRT